MSATQKKILLIDIACILVSGFIFLFLSPSIEGRQRLIYIVPQILIVGVLIIGSRLTIGIYKEYFMDVTGRNLSILYMQLIMADLFAFAIFYLIQSLFPADLRITLVRLACFVGFSLNEDDRRILAAAAKSGKTTDEIISLLEK